MKQKRKKEKFSSSTFPLPAWLVLAPPRQWLSGLQSDVYRQGPREQIPVKLFCLLTCLYRGRLPTFLLNSCRTYLSFSFSPHTTLSPRSTVTPLIPHESLAISRVTPESIAHNRTRRHDLLSVPSEPGSRLPRIHRTAQSWNN